MINSYTSTNQTIGVNENLSFSTNRVLTGCTVTHAAGTDTFSLNKPGYYYVSFNGDAVMSEAAGEITVQLLNNGVVVPGAEASTYSSAATDVVNLGFSTIVKVLPTCPCVESAGVLTLQNEGIEAIFSNVNVTITKLC